MILLFGKKAENAMPKVRDWMNNNSWVVSEIVLAGTPRGATTRGYDGAATLTRVRSRLAQARRRGYASRRRPGQPRSMAA
jgi:hypothetical protein